MDMARRGPVDAQMQQLGPAMVPAWIHQKLAPIHHGEIQIGDYVAFQFAPAIP
jgi:hypothetical protein